MFAFHRASYCFLCRESLKPLNYHIFALCNRLCMLRLYCDQVNNNINSKPSFKKNNKNSDELQQPVLDSKYEIFKESDAPVLLDVYEEKMQLENEMLNIIDTKDEFYGLNLERGVRGVFDIEDLIELLRRDKAQDIFVAVLPPEAKYVDHIVVVSSRSRRHMTALADIVRRVFKKKRLSTDIIPRIEGETSTDWMALDLGNIALHIFSRDARRIYDLESLWSVGPAFDPLINVPEDPLIALLNKHAISFSDLPKKG